MHAVQFIMEKSEGNYKDKVAEELPIILKPKGSPYPIL